MGKKCTNPFTAFSDKWMCAANRRAVDKGVGDGHPKPGWIDLDDGEVVATCWGIVDGTEKTKKKDKEVDVS